MSTETVGDSQHRQGSLEDGVEQAVADPLDSMDMELRQWPVKFSLSEETARKPIEHGFTNLTLHRRWSNGSA